MSELSLENMGHYYLLCLDLFKMWATGCIFDHAFDLEAGPKVCPDYAHIHGLVHFPDVGMGKEHGQCEDYHSLQIQKVELQ